MYIRYLLQAPILFSLFILTFFLSPFLAAISVIFNKPVLPYPLNLFHTHDDDLDGGQHQLGWPKVTGGLKLWRQRMLWMCRNPAYGFAGYVFGFPDAGSEILDQSWVGDSKRWDDGNSKTYRIVWKGANGRKYFGYRRDVRLTSRRYIKMWFGWSYGVKDGSHQLKVMFNPFETVAR